jgi:hypothetical protein
LKNGSATGQGPSNGEIPIQQGIPVNLADVYFFADPIRQDPDSIFFPIFSFSFANVIVLG